MVEPLVFEQPKQKAATFPASQCWIGRFLKDTPGGHKSYFEYLSWLSTNDEEQKKLEFGECAGWALGSKEFKASLIREETDGKEKGKMLLEGKDLEEVETNWFCKETWTKGWRS